MLILTLRQVCVENKIICNSLVKDYLELKGTESIFVNAENCRIWRSLVRSV